MIRLYDTLTRSKVPLETVRPGEVRMYSCGPTVYWFAHIGNLRAFVFSDLLHRLFARDHKVKAVMNITDVGHLTSDGDTGEDKMLVAMKREGKTAWDIARFYEEALLRDLKRMNILPFDAYPRATDHIQEQIEMIQQLEKNGFTYRTSDGIYFDTAQLPDYGRLSGQKAEDKKAGARVDMGEKKSPTDFASWKFSTTDEHRQMEWESPWGVGFPGWHIECSAMSKKYLGVPFDVHTGGIDHIAVHHENEIAQTEGAEGKMEANIWMHSEFLTVNGGKMSKSLGNLYTLDQLEEKGVDPLAYRFMLLGVHYRSKLNFSFEGLEAAQNALHKLRAFVRAAGKPGDVEPQNLRSFEAALDDDVNTPQTLAIMWKMLDAKDITPADKLATVLEFDKIFGLKLAEEVGKKDEIPADVLALAEQRVAARVAKDWKKSDELRAAIAERGFIAEDGPKGQTIRVA